MTKKKYVNPARKVFLLWAVIIMVGFLATQFYQNPQINLLWIGLAALGLGFMVTQMPLKYTGLRNILIVWLIIIGLGLGLSVAAFRVDSLAQLSGYLGIFWLVLMGIGHILTGIFDHPPIAFIANGIGLMLAGLACYLLPSLLLYQFAVAAIAGSAAMMVLFFLPQKSE